MRREAGTEVGGLLQRISGRSRQLLDGMPAEFAVRVETGSDGRGAQCQPVQAGRASRSRLRPDPVATPSWPPRRPASPASHPAGGSGQHRNLAPASGTLDERACNGARPPPAGPGLRAWPGASPWEIRRSTTGRGSRGRSGARGDTCLVPGPRAGWRGSRSPRSRSCCCACLNRSGTRRGELVVEPAGDHLLGCLRIRSATAGSIVPTAALAAAAACLTSPNARMTPRGQR